MEREVWGEYRIGLVGLSTSNPLYSAVRVGALDAAKDLEEELRLEIEIEFATSRRADADAQVKALNDYFVSGVDGVILNPANSAALSDSVDFLYRQGIPVVVYQNSVSNDEVLTSILTDQQSMGKQAMEQLKDALGIRREAVAILAGSTSSSSQERLEGAKAYAVEHNIQLYGVFTAKEEMGPAIQIVNSVTEGDRDGQLHGWLFLGPWPLMGAADLPWKAGGMPCVAIGAHPTQLRYLELGYVDALVAYDPYQWGYQSVKTLIEKLHSKKDPDAKSIVVPAEVITSENLDAYLQRWTEWLR